MTKSELQSIINEMVEDNVNQINTLYEGWQNFNISNIEESYDLAAINEKIDLEEGYGGKLRPVYIILIFDENSSFEKFVEKFVKDASYWHAAIGFGPALSRCYSFNFGGEGSVNKFKGGISFESWSLYKEIHPGGKMQVSCVFVDKDKYKEIQDSLFYFLKNKEKTKYSFINLVHQFLGYKSKKPEGLRKDLVCSTFVDTMLKSVGIDLTKKTSSLVRPDDLKAKEGRKQFKLYEGKIKDYSPKDIALKTDEYAKNLKNNFFSK